MDKQVIISYKTILLTLATLLGLYILFRLGPVIGILLISLMIVISIEPLVKKLMGGMLFGRKFSRGFSVIISYAFAVTVLAIIVTMIVPKFIFETQRLLTTLSNIFEQLNISSSVDITAEGVLREFSKISSSFFSALYGSFKFLASIFTILILSIYMSSDWERIKKRFGELFPLKVQDEILRIVAEIEVSLGHWVKGQLFLMTVVGFFSTIGLYGLGVNYALALGLLSGVLEVVPMIGPIISAVIAAIIAFVDSPIKGIGVIVLFTIIQQLENNILVPKIMQKVSGFSPLIILIALLVGNEFFGLAGAVMAVPMTMVGAIIVKRVLAYRM